MVVDKKNEIVKLYDNPTRSVHIGVDLLTTMKKGPVEFLIENALPFRNFPEEMSGIDLDIACH